MSHTSSLTNIVPENRINDLVFVVSQPKDKATAAHAPGHAVVHVERLSTIVSDTDVDHNLLTERILLPIRVHEH